MRTIKFRGKDEHGEWQEGHLLVQLGLHYILTPIWETYRHEYVQTDRSAKHRVYADSVGQFTGLLDKDGREIYEGDIVQCGTFRYKVIYERNRFASFALNRKGDAFLHFFGEAMESAECEVIGNIHDNPELIKN